MLYEFTYFLRVFPSSYQTILHGGMVYEVESSSTDWQVRQSYRETFLCATIPNINL
jgi:hypothetical protein